MKTKYLCLFVISSLMVFSLLAGCTDKEKSYVSASSEKNKENKGTQAEAVSVKQVLAKPEKYKGKKVKLQGKIVRECPTGCWFDLQDTSGIIYIELSTAGIAIPQKVGSTAVVEGKVGKRNDNIIINGEGVKIK